VKLLHIVSGNYCIVAPLGYGEWVLDFYGGKSWCNPISDFTPEFWESLWEVGCKVEIEASMSLSQYDLTLKKYMSKEEFELVD